MPPPPPLLSPRYNRGECVLLPLQPCSSTQLLSSFNVQVNFSQQGNLEVPQPIRNVEFMLLEAELSYQISCCSTLVQTIIITPRGNLRVFKHLSPSPPLPGPRPRPLLGCLCLQLSLLAGGQEGGIKCMQKKNTEYQNVSSPQGIQYSHLLLAMATVPTLSVFPAQLF